MVSVLLINGEFRQMKQHHKRLVIMSDIRLKQGESIDSVSNYTHTESAVCACVMQHEVNYSLFSFYFYRLALYHILQICLYNLYVTDPKPFNSNTKKHLSSV